MCNTLQRYKFESNSQHASARSRTSLRCAIHCKDTNLKAIHNQRCWCSPWASDVQYTAKIQIWKQFTTADEWQFPVIGMCNTLQRYKFESNSQLHGGNGQVNNTCKDTNLKAIHNHQQHFSFCQQMCNTLQRYKFKSNSQRPLQQPIEVLEWVTPCKGTNLGLILQCLFVMWWVWLWQWWRSPSCHALCWAVRWSIGGGRENVAEGVLFLGGSLAFCCRWEMLMALKVKRLTELGVTWRCRLLTVGVQGYCCCNDKWRWRIEQNSVLILVLCSPCQG